MLAIQNLRPKNFDGTVGEIRSIPKLETTAFRRELHHHSMISYLVPSERLKDLIPVEFDLGATTLLTVESFLDCGRTNFEQTNYRFQVSLRGKPCSWLLGTSLGSLSGVTARHLYPLPWHLSAMELRVALEASSEQYQCYRLSSQSQWANADWEIIDTGLPLMGEKRTEITDYFMRRDGTIGSYRTIYQVTGATRGTLKSGRCDLLGALGILSGDEIRRPISVVLHRSVSCEIQPAADPSNRRWIA